MTITLTDLFISAMDQQLVLLISCDAASVIDQQAARRVGTVRRYAQAVRHFEEEWGGLLPASSESVARYLAAHAATHSSSSLRTHLAALAQWHQQRGFADPTKASSVRDTLRGIQAEHPQPVKQAEVLGLAKLEACIVGLDEELKSGEPAVHLRAALDRAPILLGFWRALRSDELCRLQVEHIRLKTGEGLEIFLPSSKSDRSNRGRTLTLPALKRLCPVAAYEQWMVSSVLQRGAVFRSIDRWGHLGEHPLNANSISRLLRHAFTRTGVVDPLYSSHSLRRGFATWASRNQWTSKELMDYVGWRDVQSAMRYVEADAPFGEWAR